MLFRSYVCAPFDISKATDDGLVTEELLSIYRQRRGPSLIVVEQAYILPEGQWRANQLAIDRDECIPGLARLAETVHANNQVAVVQINHSGSIADTNLTGREAVAPSAIVHPLLKRSTPRGLSIDEIHHIKQAFVQAALRVKQAGFDGVQIHACHGFLLPQFLSPLTNHRTDEYGGSLGNRSRLHVEITREVRQAVGNDFLLLVRLGVDDYLPGGTILEDGCWVAQRIQDAGADILDISSGLQGSGRFTGDAFFRPMLKTVKQYLEVPVIEIGRASCRERV